MKCKKMDDSYAWLHEKAVVIYDQSKNLVRLIGVTLDITDIKNAQELLKSNKETK